MTSKFAARKCFLLVWLSLVLPAAYAQAPPAGKDPPVVSEACIVRPMPGALDDIPVFNSNSPELLTSEGILLSTFPGEGKKAPAAHLNFPLSGRFDLFAHHVVKGSNEETRTLYLGIVIGNPGTKKVKLETLAAASYLSQPDSPFVPLAPLVANDDNTVYSGPGDRATSDVLRGANKLTQGPADLSKPVTILPGNRMVFLVLPIPVQGLTPPLNGRSTLLQLKTNGPVNIATLALFARQFPGEGEKAPGAADWFALLDNGILASPRDKTPTQPQAPGYVIYGRVAGVARGSTWKSLLTDPSSVNHLSIPEPGQSISYPFATVSQGTFGTKQVQSAPMMVRYPDTAYAAHGNYAVHYTMKMPLYNGAFMPRTVSVKVQFPVKDDTSADKLGFYDEPPDRAVFRGTVRVRYKDDDGKKIEQYVHLVGKRGQRGTPLVTINMQPSTTRVVELDFLYPPDSTPPQVVTISSQ